MPALRLYQEEGVATLFQLCKVYGGGILADDMGLGKTAQAIVCAESLRKTGQVLIVCPASVRPQWVKEIETWAGAIAREFGPPSKSKRFKSEWAEEQGRKWNVVSYNLAEKAADLLRPTVIIMDEAHNLKGRRNSWALTLRDICKTVPYKIAITGTPIWSRPCDMWNVLNLALGYKVSGRARDFDTQFCNGHDGAWGWVNDGATNLGDLKHLVNRYSVHRTKSEVLKDLPELTRVVRWVEKEDSLAKKLFEAAIVEGKQSAVHEAVAATLLAKLPEAVSACVEARQFVCFTQLRAHAEDIADRVSRAGVPCYWIHGGMEAGARQAVIAKAEEEQCGIVATIDSIGTGVNLQGVASVGIMHGLDFVPMKLMQAEARLHRLGQKNAVTWIYIALRDSIDERIIAVIVERLDTWRLSVGSAGDGSEQMRGDLDGSAVAPGMMDSVFAELCRAT